MKVAPAFFAAVVAFGAGSAAGQSDQPGPQVPTFRSTASIVSLNVTVQDPSSKFVLGLQPADFAVFEDGVRQDVQFFESTRVPLDLIVLIDTSSSMRDKLDLVHDAASGFLKTLRAGDRGAVVGFADHVNVLQALTSDQALLEKAVRTADASGATCLNNAVYIALKQFGQAAQQNGQIRRQALVVLSDGEDTSSLISFDDVLAMARRTGVNVYTVSLVQSRADAERAAKDGIKRFFTQADYAMRTLSRETGAQSFFPQPTALKTVYSSIATELASQYSIGYVPKSPQDGKFRRVLVQIITRPELRSRTRVGYTSETEAATPPMLHEREGRLPTGARSAKVGRPTSDVR